MKQFLFQCQALRLSREDALSHLTHIESIVLIGTTCSGKTTMGNAIRDAAKSWNGQIDIPVRYITRPSRGNDNIIENRHVSPAEFEALISDGEIGLRWKRPMEGKRQEQYGFSKPSQDTLTVYSGNNALFTNPDSVQPRRALRHSLVIGVHAPKEVRAQRLLDRSPDLHLTNPYEVAYRLAETSKSLFQHAHVVIDNHGPMEKTAPLETAKFIDLIASAFTWTLV